MSALVNNAGIVDQTARVDAMTLQRLQRLQRMFEVNVFGSFLCAREAVKRMSTRYGGAGDSIVNVSPMGRAGGAEKVAESAMGLQIRRSRRAAKPKLSSLGPNFACDAPSPTGF